MISTLITSRTRIKLLIKFFLNPNNSAWLRGLEAEFDESSNAIRLELNKLEGAKMIVSESQGNRKLYKVNKDHPLYLEINSIVRKYFGLDVIIEKIAQKLGQLKSVYLTGDIALGKDTDIIDLVLVGQIDKNYLVDLVQKAESLINRKIRFLTYSSEEFKVKVNSNLPEYLLIWRNEKLAEH